MTNISRQKELTMKQNRENYFRASNGGVKGTVWLPAGRGRGLPHTNSLQYQLPCPLVLRRSYESKGERRSDGNTTKMSNM